MKTRKYSYQYVLQGNYGQGWEDLCAEDKHSDRNQYGSPWQRIKADKKAYQENDRSVLALRIISRREINACQTI